jgi:hypothetical protein
LIVTIEECIEIEDKRKAELIIDLVTSHSFVIKVESLKNDVEKFGQFDEFNTSLCLNFLVANATIVKIIMVQELRFDVPLKTKFQTAVVYFLINVLDY